MPDRHTPADVPLACDLLVFDLDGTLIDSQQDLANAVNATLTHFGRPVLPLQRVAGFVGDGVSMLVTRALDATGDEDARATEDLLQAALPFFLGFYREHKLDHTYVYPGVLDALAAIREAAPELPMAVLTNKPVRPSREICDHLGLSRFLFQNYGGDSFALKKPHPLGLEILIEEATLTRPVERKRTVLVGDSHVDVQTAHAAGVLSLGCLHGLDRERMLAEGPDAVAEQPSDWLPALRSLLA
jgi:phosphoglycolate phosphatase